MQFLSENLAKWLDSAIELCWKKFSQMFPRKWPLVENNDCLGKIVQVFFHRSLNYTGVWPPCCRSRVLSQGPYRNHASKCLLKKILFCVEIWLHQLRDHLLFNLSALWGWPDDAQFCQAWIPSRVLVWMQKIIPFLGAPDKGCITKMSWKPLRQQLLHLLPTSG